MSSEDPYYTEGYSRLSALIEGGAAEIFRMETDNGSVTYPVIIRQIDSLSGSFSDLITPYGYGGPRIRVRERASRQALVEEFKSSFSDFAKDRNVVTEFVRFHPFDTKPEEFESFYELEKIRDTVISELSGPEAIMREFSKNARKKIRRNERSGVEVTLTHGFPELAEFQHLYELAMNRNRASDFYYFGQVFFEELVEEMGERLLLATASIEGRAIGGMLCLLGAHRVYVFLSGTDSEFMKFSPDYSLHNAIAEWAIENDYKVVFHGGGRTNDMEDSLLAYKRQFGTGLAPFYVGRKVWNTAAYSELCKLASVPENSTYFPAYRVGR